MKRAAWINVAIGFWLVISAFTGHAQSNVGGRMVNDLFSGLVLMFAALWYLADTGMERSACVLAVCVGAWQVVSPFLLSYTSWGGLACGLVAIIVALVDVAAIDRRVAV
jgi:hypothetical protein